MVENGRKCRVLLAADALPADLLQPHRYGKLRSVTDGTALAEILV
jgi:hypothetical protein